MFFRFNRFSRVANTMPFRHPQPFRWGAVPLQVLPPAEDMLMQLMLNLKSWHKRWEVQRGHRVHRVHVLRPFEGFGKLIPGRIAVEHWKLW